MDRQNQNTVLESGLRAGGASAMIEKYQLLLWWRAAFWFGALITIFISGLAVLNLIYRNLIPFALDLGLIGINAWSLRRSILAIRAIKQIKAK